MIDYEVLRFIWWLLVGVLLIGFAVTDGFDMGVGMLTRFLGRNDTERRIMINSIAPHWDGNQVWLITAGGALFAAWPMVYAAAFSGFYVAMILVLASLFFRPVGFDYRSKIEETRWRNMWDWGIFIGSFVPPLVIGVAFGNLLQGVPFNVDEYLRLPAGWRGERRDDHYSGRNLSANAYRGRTAPAYPCNGSGGGTGDTGLLRTGWRMGDVRYRWLCCEINNGPLRSL